MMDFGFSVQTFSYWIANRCRASYDNGLPADLRLSPSQVNQFVRQRMLREAGLTADVGVAFGIFKLIGSEHARRASRAWRPRALLLMEDLSLAFEVVEQRRQRGFLVADDDFERLVRLLQAFFPTIGVKLSQNAAREMVGLYLAEHSLPDVVPAPAEPEEIVVSHPLLDELREVAAEVKTRFESPWGNASLLDIGLGVGDKLSFSTYAWCSPLNCATFASTGSDGTHFSLLLVDGEIGADSPVVMTTPANMGNSVIVGQHLFDFLCLGSRSGYFLDSLAGSDPSPNLMELIDATWYPGKPASEWLARQTGSFPDNILAFLVDRLDLHPWTDAVRFEELQEKYASLLRLPPDVRR